MGAKRFFFQNHKIILVNGDTEKYLLLDNAFRSFYNTVRPFIKSEDDLRMLGE